MGGWWETYSDRKSKLAVWSSNVSPSNGLKGFVVILSANASALI
jgi:hypothetical protein